MPDDFIKHMVQTVIESFPIDEAKKADMLQNIVDKKEKDSMSLSKQFTDNQKNEIA